MNALSMVVAAIAAARKDPAMRGAEETCLTLDTEVWTIAATDIRDALASLRKIQRIGRQAGGLTEEAEIARDALRRIERRGP